MDIVECMLTRRSVRKLQDRALPDDTIARLSDAVQWSPSWANTQCVELIAVQDKETIRKLQRTVSEKNPALLAFDTAPLVMVVLSHRNQSGYKKGEVLTDKGDWYLFDAGIAAQQLALAVHALGLATVHVGLLDHAAAGALMALPEGVEVVELLPIGYPESIPKAPKRKPRDQFLSFESYGKRTHS